ncbi:MAG: glycosyltransferase, partial [Chloroflexi bacterium]|nr:glycosyltransferase [Chloroflexota bacterium]
MNDFYTQRSAMTSSRRALVCAPLMPEFDRQSGERRIWHLVEFLRGAGWRVTFVSEHGQAESRYLRMLQQAGVASYVAADRRDFEMLLRSQRFDIALLAFWHVAERFIPIIRALSPATRIVVDSVDVHFLRQARQQLLPRSTSQLSSLEPEFGTLVVRELNAYAAADAVLTVSEKEATLVNDFVADPMRAHVVPDAEQFERSSIPRAQRRGILFIGSFGHPPNVEAVAYLCQEIVPQLDPATLGSHPVQVVGNQLDERIRRYGQCLRNVEMIGWVPSVLPYLERACMTVIPLLHGAGTKRKLIQALMVGTPTVATSIGTEGLDVQDGEHLLVADTAASFAGAIERLSADAELWHRLADNGATHV